MKKSATLLFLVLISFLVHSQTCTPTWPMGGGDGVMPTSLPPAYEGSAYSASVNFKVPLDTTYKYGSFTVPAVLDTIKIDSVIGLNAVPASVAFKYVTNPATGYIK